MGEYFQIQDDYLGEKERKLKRVIEGEKTEESERRRENWREWEKERKLKRVIEGEKTEESDRRRENWREW